MNRQKEIYEQRKEQRLCVRCGRPDGRTEKGMALCEECASKEAKKTKMRQHKWVLEGKCVRCGKPTTTYLKCFDCRMKGSEANARYRQKLKGVV